MLCLKGLLDEYMVHCQVVGLTEKTLLNKRKELSNFYDFLTDKRGISQLHSMSEFDMKAYSDIDKNQDYSLPAWRQ
ncbi:hypothetical protein [Sporosarcina highlanderae]|uniref:Core-binding (CB) domain-containing protein n=1 Tax=Sporosarcina highlanderae TaxID=3035916 RepID=A0ABT8JQE3_9BACL|nr:hypothetical protein [Sporosarcina highlanderae]MDN4607375.1 hypothetical protein [Sporosarcina highlanderae]